MKGINIYLSFDGNCKEAFEFYRAVFGGEFITISPFSEMPPMHGMPPMKEELKSRTMHVTLAIRDNIVLQGSDTFPGAGPEYLKGNNFSISITPDNLSEADALMAKLSEGGIVTMTMQKTFWNSYFGSCIDKYGTSWMINLPLPNENPA